MSESTMQSATELASQYSVQVTDDLERNVKEQERVSAEITALQQQLAALQHDHTLLVNMQQALGITSPPSPSAPEPAAAAEAATVPAPRGGAQSRPAAGKSARSRKAAAAPKRAAAPKAGAKAVSKPSAKKATDKTTAKTVDKTPAKTPAKTPTKTVDKAPAKAPAQAVDKTPAKSADKAPGKTAAKSAGKPAAKKAAPRDAGRPTLVELVREHLAGQREPRSAAEVTTALSEAHSGRTVKTTVVRTTLEGLVAKNQAQRTKQGTSVYYTATEPAAPEGAQAAAAEAPAAQSGS